MVAKLPAQGGSLINHQKSPRSGDKGLLSAAPLGVRVSRVSIGLPSITSKFLVGGCPSVLELTRQHLPNNQKEWGIQLVPVY